MSGGVILVLAFLVFGAAGVLLMLRQRKARFWHFALMAGGPILVLVGYALVVIPQQKAALAPFKPYADEYLSLPGKDQGRPGLQLNSALHTQQAAAPYIRGKVIPLQIRDKSPDMLYFRLPEELRAGTPEEVGTVVWLDCTGVTRVIRRVAGATDNTVDYRCDVAVIDKSLSAIVGAHSFTATAGEQGYQDVLYDDIRDYLAGLPRR